MKVRYETMNDEELRQLMESDSLNEYEKYEILTELLDRGSVILDRIETIH